MNYHDRIKCFFHDELGCEKCNHCYYHMEMVYSLTCLMRKYKLEPEDIVWMARLIDNEGHMIRHEIGLDMYVDASTNTDVDKNEVEGCKCGCRFQDVDINNVAETGCEAEVNISTGFDTENIGSDGEDWSDWSDKEAAFLMQE